MAIGEALTALKNDSEITSAEITEARLNDLRQEIEDCSPEQTDQCVAILEAAINRAEGDAATRLQQLKNNIENSEIEYSIDGLIEHVEKDEKAKAFLELYNSVIASDLSEIYGENYNILTESSKNTIQLVFWNIIQGQLGIKGGTKVLGSMTGISSLIEGFSDIFGDADPEATESVLTATLESKQEAMEQFSGVKGVSETLSKDVSNIIDVVESLIGKQANNLDVLLRTTSDLGNEQKAQIFENPLVVEAVMNTGKYNEEGFNIDLTTDPHTLNIGNISDIQTVQNTYMEELKKDTANIGGRMDKMRGLKEKTDKFLEKLGFEGGTDAMFESLYKIPVLGIFFKMIFGDFFDQFEKIESAKSIERVIEAMKRDPIAMKSLRVLQNDFEKDFGENYESEKDTAIGKIILGDGLSPEFYTSISEEGKFFTVLQDANIDYSQSDFWDQIFMGEGTTPQTSVIHNKLLSIGIHGTTELSDKKIATTLNSITPEDFPVVKARPPKFSSPAAGTDAVGTVGVTQEIATESGVTPPDLESDPFTGNTQDPNNLNPSGDTSLENTEQTGVTGDSQPTATGIEQGSTQQTIEEIPEMTPVPPLIEQIRQIQSLPTTLHIEGKGDLYIGAFDNLRQSITIGADEYTVSLRAGKLFGGVFAPKMSQVIQSFNIVGGKGILRVDGQEEQGIDSGDILSLLEDFIETGTYSLTNQTKDGEYEYTLEIK